MAFLPPLCVAVVLAGPFLLSQSPAPPRDRPRPLEAPSTGVLAGRVTNDAGEPARDLVVQAVRFTFGDTGRRLSSVRLAGARTDDLGRYRIHDLPAGDYFVSAAPDPFAPVVRAPLQARPSGIARTYYPGTTQLRAARRVTLAAGQEIVSLDFAVERVILGIITGRVVDSAGRPAVVGSVEIQPVDGPLDDIRGVGFTHGGTEFQMLNVPPGDYWLTTATMPSQDAAPEFFADRVTIAPDSGIGAVLHTAPGATGEGRLEVDGDAPPSMRLQVTAIDTEYRMQGPPVAVPIGPDGRFTVTSLFGRKLLRLTGLPAGWALTGIWIDDELEITDSPIDFSATPERRRLRVAITNKTASISGTAVDARHRLVACRVVIFSEDDSRWGPGSRFIRSVATAGGPFTIDALLPGKYLIAGVGHMDDGSWNDPGVLQRLRAIATPLTLGEHDTQTVTLKVSPIP